MSDKENGPTEVFELDDDGKEVPVRDRTEAELEALRDQMQMGDGHRYGGYNYTAMPAEGYDTPGLWLCHLASTKSGYAHIGHALCWAVYDHLKLPMQLVPHRSIKGIDVSEVPKDREEDVVRWLKGAIGLGRALIVTLPPQGAAQMNGYGKTRVVCYATHECDRVSPATAEICNPGPEEGGFTRIWLKSPFAMRSFIAGGVRPERLRLVPPPLIGGPWKAPDPRILRDRPPAGERPAPFRFGMLGTWIERKGFEDLLRAYYTHFTREDNVLLELKTSPLNEYDTIAEMETACRTVAKRIREELDIEHESRARVLFKVGVAETDQEVIDWCSGLDCFANSSYGEGLGVPQIYALAAGVPMVTTGFGAVGDLVGECVLAGSSYHQIIPDEEERIGRDMLRVSRMYDAGQKWGRYDPAAFGRGMRRVFDARAVPAATAPAGCSITSELVSTRFSFETCAPVIRDAIAELVQLSEFTA